MYALRVLFSRCYIRYVYSYTVDESDTAVRHQDWPATDMPQLARPSSYSRQMPPLTVSSFSHHTFPSQELIGASLLRLMHDTISALNAFLQARIVGPSDLLGSTFDCKSGTCFMQHAIVARSSWNATNGLGQLSLRRFPFPHIPFHLHPHFISLKMLFVDVHRTWVDRPGCSPAYI